jgi:hypothetical protein
MYGSLADGLYWVYERAGAVERLVTDAQIERFVHEPPEDTRAWTRAMLLRRAPPGTVDRVDWDEITFRRRDRSGWPARRTVNLPNPLGFRKTDTENLFLQTETLDDVLATLAPEDEASAYAGSGWSHGPQQTFASYDLPVHVNNNPGPVGDDGPGQPNPTGGHP